MKYFLDTEFHEYRKQPIICRIKVGKSIDTIELISIGIVSEDYFIPAEQPSGKNTNGLLFESITPKSKKYYAICKDFDLKTAWYSNQGTKEKPNYWLRNNVLLPIHNECIAKEWEDNNRRSRLGISLTGNKRDNFTLKNFSYFINKYGKTRKKITEEIEEFVYFKEPTITKENLDKGYKQAKIDCNGTPEFYAYYADYDWVVFCWLFGRMIDLPTGFPMYCNDLKQELERLNETLGYNCDEKGNDYKLQEHVDYPKQTNEHNALSDAKWNKDLYYFMQNL